MNDYVSWCHECPVAHSWPQPAVHWLRSRLQFLAMEASLTLAQPVAPAQHQRAPENLARRTGCMIGHPQSGRWIAFRAAHAIAAPKVLYHIARGWSP